MKVVKVILLAVLVIIVFCGGTLVIAGLLIPAERSFANEIEINASADTVWQVINDRDKYKEWQPNLERVEVVDDKNWIEYPKNSPEQLQFHLYKDQRPTRMEFDYLMGNDFSGLWQGDITPTASGVKLRTVDSYSTRGFITRVMVYVFFDLNSFARDWNQKLKQRAESLSK